MTNVLNLQDCSLQDLLEAIKIAEKLASLTDVLSIEVFVKGIFEDKNGDTVFANHSWHKLIDCTHTNRRNKFFTLIIDSEETLVTPTQYMDVQINV